MHSTCIPHWLLTRFLCIPCAFRMRSAYISCGFLMHFQCILMYFPCISNAFCMHFTCISHAYRMHFHAYFMHLSLVDVFPSANPLACTPVDFQIYLLFFALISPSHSSVHALFCARSKCFLKHAVFCCLALSVHYVGQPGLPRSVVAAFLRTLWCS